MATQADKAKRFAELHRLPGAFLIPNPWDVGSARILEALGFEALATTSSGFANTLGIVDGAVTLNDKLAHCRALAAATALPISADLENGYGDGPAAAAEAVSRIAEAGAVGASIEDYSRDDGIIYDFALAVERVGAAAEAARRLPFPFQLTARAENLLRGRDDLDDTIRRLQAFADAGADVLYAPGLRTLDQVRAITAAVDKPVNVLGPMVRDATLAALADAGVKRVSVGGALARAASAAFIRAATELREAGGFGWMKGLAGAPSADELLSR